MGLSHKLFSEISAPALYVRLVCKRTFSTTYSGFEGSFASIMGLTHSGSFH